ncbi:MAG: efflux RND transporter periplasmic adaptor subunit [bacterium]
MEKTVKPTPEAEKTHQTMGMDRKIEKKMWTPKRIVLITAGTLFTVFVIYIIFLGSNASSVNADREQMTISEIVKGPFQEYVQIIGTVLPIKTVYLDPVQGGRVEKVYVEAGAMVKKGEQLMKLSNTSLLLDIMYKESELYRQSNELRNTRISMEQQRLALENSRLDFQKQLITQKRKYETTLALFKKELASKDEYEQEKEQYEYLEKKINLTVESQRQDSLFRLGQIEALESSLKHMQNNLTIARQNLENLTIRATVSGQLTSFNAEIGESKSPGQRIGQIDVLDGFKVRADIDEHYISKIEIGKTALGEFSGKKFIAMVKKIFPEVNNGKFQVDLEFQGNQPEGIRRGQTVHARLELSGERESLLLSKGGFYSKTGGNWVYVLEPSGTVAVKRNIRLGLQNPEFLEVLEGLKAGDMVVTSSYDNYGDMDRLILK